MTRRRNLALLLTAAGVGTAASIVALAAQSGPGPVHGPQAAAEGRTTGSTVSTDTGPVAFHLQDDRNGMHLAVMLDATSDHYGVADVTIPGVGLIETTNPAALDRHSDTSTTLAYDGPALLDRREAADTEFGIITDAAHRPETTSTTVRLQGQVDPVHHSGELNVWIGQDKYHLLRSNVPVAGAEQTAARIRSSLIAGDLDGLYDLLDPSAKASVGHDEFVSRMRSGLGGPVTDVSYGAFTYTTTAASIDYASAPITVTAGPTGTMTTHGTLQLIRVLGAWKLYQIKPSS
ncbi:MAG: hypothetical protein WCD35_19130 [Mycobacteriales bacterium]